MSPKQGTSNRGFAAMDEQKQREIARKGGLTKGPNVKNRGGSKEQHSKAGKQSHKNS